MMPMVLPRTIYKSEACYLQPVQLTPLSTAYIELFIACASPRFWALCSPLGKRSEDTVKLYGCAPTTVGSIPGMTEKQAERKLFVRSSAQTPHTSKEKRLVTTDICLKRKRGM